MAGRRKGSKVKQTEKFKEKRKKTQFGAPGGNKPNKPSERGYNPMNLRGAQRHLASQEIDRHDPKALEKLMGHHTCSIAELIAFTQLRKAIGGDNVAIAAVTDNLCGKLEDTHVFKDERKRERGVRSTNIEEARARLEELNSSKG